MIIRKASDQDISAIVKVLKASLGEEDLPLSEAIWRYKHIQNPFGNSVVLVAEEEGNIIGVRAFMKWQWQLKDKKLSSFRAVDTATHPDHQGKGIFKKLTLQAVAICEESGGHLIFNTPNEKSRPGYLKMGWISAGKLEVQIKPAFNSFWRLGRFQSRYQKDIRASSENIEELCNLWNAKLRTEAHVFTPKSRSYLLWRYEKNSLIDYEVLATKDFYMAAYVKQRKGIKELRIAECIFLNKDSRNLIRQTLEKWCSQFGVQVMSFSRITNKAGIFTLTGAFGPVLTVRALDLNTHEKDTVGHTQNWRYSLGDLELF